MSAVHAFVAGRGAISIRELAAWLDRGHSYVYALVGRGQLRMFGPGKVTADSVVEFYHSFEGGGATELKHSTSGPSPSRPQAEAHTESGQVGAVTGGANSARGAL